MTSPGRTIAPAHTIGILTEPGVFFTGRCTMLENGPEGVDLGAEHMRPRELVRD